MLKATEVVRAFFDETLLLGSPAGWTAEEHEVFDRWSDPDIQYREDPKWPGAGVYRGRQEVKKAFAQVAEVFPNMEGKLESVHEGPGGIVALVRFTGEAAASGVPNDHVWGYLCQVEGEKVISSRAYWEPAEALRDAGVDQLD